MSSSSATSLACCSMNCLLGSTCSPHQDGEEPIGFLSVFKGYFEQDAGFGGPLLFLPVGLGFISPNPFEPLDSDTPRPKFS